MTHKELAAHFRSRLAASGIKAKCNMQDLCGNKMIAIDTPSFEYEFSELEQNVIADIALALRMTLIRGLPIEKNGTFTKGVKFQLEKGGC